MKKIFIILLAILSFSCSREDEDITPQSKQVKKLSKVYNIEFSVRAKNGGTVDVCVPTALVSDNYAGNDTTGGRYRLDFTYSFKSDLVNNIWIEIRNLIPRSQTDYYIASIKVDGVVVASDSIRGVKAFGWKTKLEYVVEK